MIDLQEPFKGRDIQFSSLIVYHCQDDHSRYCLVPLSRGRVGFLLAAPFIISASGCANFPVSQPGSFPFGEEPAARSPLEQQQPGKKKKKIKVQNGLARLLINSRRCCRTSVIPSAGAVSPPAMATVKVPPRSVNVTVRRLCQNQHLVDCIH